MAVIRKPPVPQAGPRDQLPLAPIEHGYRHRAHVPGRKELSPVSTQVRAHDLFASPSLDVDVAFEQRVHLHLADDVRQHLRVQLDRLVLAEDPTTRVSADRTAGVRPRPPSFPYSECPGSRRNGPCLRRRHVHSRISRRCWSTSRRPRSGRPPCSCSAGRTTDFAISCRTYLLLGCLPRCVTPSM